MGFWTELGKLALAGATNAGKNQYRKRTGRNYEDDVNKNIRKYNFQDDLELSREWNRLRDTTDVQELAKKEAVRQLMKKRHLEID